MITPEEFVEKWSNPEDLVRYDPKALQTIDIPNDAKEFLIRAGLPKRDKYNVFFTSFCMDIPILGSKWGDNKIKEDCASLRVLGYYQISPSPLISAFKCMQVGTGKLIVTARLGGLIHMPFFLNSSIQQYAEFLVVKSKYWDEVKKIDQKYEGLATYEEEDEARHRGEYLPFAMSVFDQLHYIDPQACLEADHYLKHGTYLSDNGFESMVWTTNLVRLKTIGAWF